LAHAGLRRPPTILLQYYFRRPDRDGYGVALLECQFSELRRVITLSRRLLPTRTVTRHHLAETDFRDPAVQLISCGQRHDSVYCRTLTERPINAN